MANLRLDRVLSLHLPHPWGSHHGQDRRRVPILMYHSIRDGTDDSRPYYETSTSPQVFRRQMQYLHEQGYRTLRLDEVVDVVAGPEDGSPAVAITFDDGYTDFSVQAFPVLREFGFTATVFVVTGLLNSPGTQFRGKTTLSAAEIRELYSLGVRFGSHTVSHRDLNRLPRPEIERELADSKKALEAALGAPIHSFSYPFAFPETDSTFVADLAAALELTGYRHGVSTILGTAGPASNRFFLPRLPINVWDDPPLFQAKLRGAYDWMHLPQYVAKLVTARFH